MTEALQTFLAPPELKTTLYPLNSRYHGVDIASLKKTTGETVVYLKRRFLPDPAKLTTLLIHPVVEGDRLDNLAFRYLEDPELFWRICDGNFGMRPDELVETVGRLIQITLAEGVPGVSGE